MTQPRENLSPASLEEAAARILSLQTDNHLLRLQIAQLKARLFGPASERLPLEDRQLPLLSEVFEPAEPPVTEDVLVDAEEKPARKKAVRHPMPEHLEVVEERIEPADCQCPHCGGERVVIREETSERYDFIPAKMVRHRLIRPVMACPKCKEGVAQAPLPPALIPKGVCSDAMIAHVVVQKYLEHRPLYRQQQEFLRLGANLSRTVLSDAVEAAALALQPLWKLIRDGLAQGDYLQVDETPVRVMDPEVKGKTGQGWLWVYHRPGGDVLFDYRDGRSRAGPGEILKGFKGTLQSDGYSVYETLGGLHPDWKRLGCMAHVRRKFHEALQDQPERARWFIGRIALLYGIEKDLRAGDAKAGERFARRQAASVPVLEEIRARLGELNPEKPASGVLPKSPLGKAVRYALNQWEYVRAYVDDGKWEIDQNLVENAIRPSCVGKKNWLFIGSPGAGWRSAVIYTMIINCQRRGINPIDWMNDVFRRLPSTLSQNAHELLPAHWKKQPA